VEPGVLRGAAEEREALFLDDWIDFEVTLGRGGVLYSLDPKRGGMVEVVL
jgi:hypothetical protein